MFDVNYIRNNTCNMAFALAIYIEYLANYREFKGYRLYLDYTQET